MTIQPLNFTAADGLTDALAEPAPAGGLADLEHVIFLMQENRSFDHYYGTLRGVRGFADPAAIRLRSGGDVFFQPTRSGLTVPPFPVRAGGEEALTSALRLRIGTPRPAAEMGLELVVEPTELCVDQPATVTATWSSETATKS